MMMAQQMQIMTQQMSQQHAVAQQQQQQQQQQHMHHLELENERLQAEVHFSRHNLHQHPTTAGVNAASQPLANIDAQPTPYSAAVHEAAPARSVVGSDDVDENESLQQNSERACAAQCCRRLLAQVATATPGSYHALAF